MATGDDGGFPEGEKYYGLQSRGEASWCHSVVQALYFCLPFRGRLLECYEKNKEFAGGKENLLTVLAGLLNQLTPKKLLEYFAKSKDVAGGKENLLSALAGLFNQISSQEKQTSVIDTESFVQIAIANGFVKVPSVFETACAAAVAINGGSQLVVDAMSELHSQVQLMSSDAKLSLEEVLKQNLKSLGVDLDSLMDPSDEEERNLTDPYNFLNLVLNEVDEKMKKDSAATGHQVFKMPLIALLEDLQGIVADMRCAMCKTDKAKDQTVFTLSLDVAQHRSLAALLGDFNFNSWSIMHKLPCEKCGRDQDAEKRFVMKKAPRILIIHLKRFKDSGGDGLKKLSDEVSIPLSLQL